MKLFEGFPPGTKNTPIANLFFSDLLPHITDVAELKVTLHVLWALYQKKTYPKFLTQRELLADRTLMSGLAEEGNKFKDTLERGLKLAVQRGTLLHLALDRDGEQEDLYFLNSASDKEAMEKIKRDEASLGSLPQGEPFTGEPEGANIFSLYEANIGVITPLISEELKDAESEYPPKWIEEAFREAVSLNKRSWRYISRILERWATEGRGYGESGRDYQKKRDPNRYTKGRYGHIVRR